MELSEIRSSDRITQEADIVIAWNGKVLKDREGPDGVTVNDATIAQLWRSDRKVMVVSVSGRARTNWTGSSDSGFAENYNALEES